MRAPTSNSLPFWIDLLAVFFLGIVVRIAFIRLHPAIYGGDTLVRIMNGDRVLLAYQLPLLQLLIYLVNRVSSDPLHVRYLISLIGALAGTAFYLLSATLLDRPTARLACLFFVFNPFLLVHSIVPYQEILMLLALFLGLHFLLRPDLRETLSRDISLPWLMNASVPPWTRGDFRGVQEIGPPPNLSQTPPLPSEAERLLPPRIGWASLFLGLACLTRYEAWVITAAVGLYYGRSQLNAGRSAGYARLLAKIVVLFGWGPLLWIALHHGVSPQGTYVLEGPATWARLWRIPHVAIMALYHAGPIAGLLAVLGMVGFWKQSLVKKPAVQMVLATAVLLMLSLIFSAHGVAPDPQRYVTDREAHWFVLFAFWAAALGLSALKQSWMPHVSDSKPSIASRNRCNAIFYAVLVLAVAWGLFQTDRYIKRLLNDQNLVLDYAVAQHLERNLPRDANALVFAQPLPPEATREFFDKVYSQGGTMALETARRQLAEISSGPLDYSRIVVNTRRGKKQILDGSKLVVNASEVASFFSQNRIPLVAVFSNYPSQEANTRELLDYVKQKGKLQVSLEDRGLQVSIYGVQF